MKIRTFTHILIPLLVCSWANAQAGITDALFGPDNYWECLLDSMPGTMTYGGSMENIARCEKKFPDKSAYKTKNAVFGPKNYGQCLQKYASQTQEPLARQSILNACYRLYPPQ
ncbi:MAG: hypothetical protein AXA67_05670 [Methylothermaceae bacteria B42]|nr:MAG: hypothetical protein AXA67_05670 [Methylothermaceae bacteria B42]HHJ40341.1 hypothetical protein [Methylothermaceae bacterium]